jgi:alkanesulfonate monooxygenase
MEELLWYIPNTVEAGIRGDDVASGWADLERSVTLARMAEDHGWGGALLGTSWGRPDTFTVATALAARTTTFKPLIAVRPGYWRPAHFASAAATLDHLTGGRVLVNIVSGQDNLAAYGDHEADRGARYARTREFMRLVRLLWTSENVTYRGEHFGVEGSTVVPTPRQAPWAVAARPRPGLSAPTTRSPTRFASTVTWASATSSSRTRRTCASAPGSATRSCRGCGPTTVPWRPNTGFPERTVVSPL